jgi:hypothetical protein
MVWSMVPEPLLRVNVPRIMRPTMDAVATCPQCNRNNAVRRTTCLYCGAALPVTDQTASVQVPVLRPVEEFELGYSVVLAPLDREAPTDRQVMRFCEITHMEEELAQAVFAARVSLPVARVPTEGEAGLVARLLGETDLGATVVPDATLEVGRLARRVREIRLGPEAIEAHVLWGDWIALRRDDLLLAVEGHVVSTRVEVTESATGRRGKMDVDDTSQYFLESYAIDLYGPSIDASIRIKADSFDFACLGWQPSPRLDENIGALARQLRDYIGASRYDASFAKVAKLLEHAWPSASSVRSKGLLWRGNFKRYTQSSITTDAAGQFNRYSRMRYVLANAAD